MKAVVLLITALCAVTNASPNGYYHQQYNYKTSSSSFKNNELQHKTDDQGYYQREGDLEGRVRPKVASNSEHSEYVNPNQNHDYNGNQELSSHGNLVARDTYGGSGSNLYQGLSQNLATGLSSYGSGGYGSHGSYGSYSGYGSSQSASLNSVASSVQRDLQQELESSLRRINAYHSSIDALEEELRRNLTERFNQALTEQYGQQSIRGGQSYSISNGRLQTVPNYQQQDLVSIQRQLENTLLANLRKDYSQRVSQQTYNENYVQHSEKTTVRPVIVYHQSQPQPQAPYHYEPIRIQAPSTPAPHEYHQNRNVESLTTVGTRVMQNIDSELNRVLSLVGSSGYDNQYLSLENLQNQLRHNITRFLDEEMRREYGSQSQRDGYMFSSGQYNTYNYKLEDMENIKQQIEHNLIEKLNREYQNQIARVQSAQYQQSQRYSSGSHSSGYQSGQSAGYQGDYRDYERDYDTTTAASHVGYHSTRPTSASIVPLVENGLNQDSYGSSSNYAAGMTYGGHQSGYSAGSQSGYSGASQSGYSVSSSQSMAELQRQLESELSRQLQQAINQNSRYSSQYRDQGYTNLQAYDTSFKQLSEELNRNLTSQLQQFMEGGSHSSSYGGSFNQGQLESLRSQLQSQLSKQLQNGLSQAYSASASYSASSSHSSSSGGSYRGERGSENYSNGGYGYGQQQLGQYSSYGNGQDCQVSC